MVGGRLVLGAEERRAAPEERHYNRIRDIVPAMIFTAAAGLLLALVLWSVGLFTVLPPVFMGALVGLTEEALVWRRGRVDTWVDPYTPLGNSKM